MKAQNVSSSDFLCINFENENEQHSSDSIQVANMSQKKIKKLTSE